MLGWADPRAVVPHRKLVHVVGQAVSDLDPPAALAIHVLDGIVDEVPEHLDDSLALHVQHWHLTLDG